jgi:hydroxyethylthiazole kinase-like uncharacterized protein yjeF
MATDEATAGLDGAADGWHAALPGLAAEAHKHLRGSVLAVAGGIEGVGAPRLAARAALRIGAGLVTIAAPRAAMAAHAARGPDALMLRQAEDGAALRALADAMAQRGRRLVVALGPALGFDARASDMMEASLQLDLPLVLDADALTLLARMAQWRLRLAARAAPAVLTPHEGEFARLMPQARLDDGPATAKAIRRREAALALAQDSGAVLLLKGPGTVIAAPDGRCAVNATGGPALATAGSGDVLAGAVAGLMAQGMPAFEAAAAAAHLHGAAGDALGPGLIADDLPEALARLRWQGMGKSGKAATVGG